MPATPAYHARSAGPYDPGGNAKRGWLPVRYQAARQGRLYSDVDDPVCPPKCWPGGGRRYVSDRGYGAMLDTRSGARQAERGRGFDPALGGRGNRGGLPVGRFDTPALGAQAAVSGNPAFPSWGALTRVVALTAGASISTASQDVSMPPRCWWRTEHGHPTDLDDHGLAGPALRRHRTTLLPGRTLLQHALPRRSGSSRRDGSAASRRRPPASARSGAPGSPSSSAGPPAPWPRSATTEPRSQLCSPPSSAWPIRSCPGIPTARGSPSSRARWAWPPAPLRRSLKTSCCWPRQRSPRSESGGPRARVAPRRFRRSKTRSRRSVQSPTHGRHPVSSRRYLPPWIMNTNELPERGTPNGGPLASCCAPPARRLPVAVAGGGGPTRMAPA